MMLKRFGAVVGSVMALSVFSSPAFAAADSFVDDMNQVVGTAGFTTIQETEQAKQVIGTLLVILDH